MKIYKSKIVIKNQYFFAALASDHSHNIRRNEQASCLQTFMNASDQILLSSRKSKDWRSS